MPRSWRAPAADRAPCHQRAGGTHGGAPAAADDYYTQNRPQARWHDYRPRRPHPLRHGAFAGSSPGVASVATLVLAGPYKIPHMRLEGCAVYTNKANFGSFRAPSGPQACFAVESHMDIIAGKLGLDPLAFRLCISCASLTGQVLTDVSSHQVLERAAAAIGWGTAAGPHRGKLACSWWTVTGVLLGST